MTKHRNELDDKNLQTAAGGKPEHVIVPDVDKVRDDRKAEGGLTETGDCGGGVKTLKDIELLEIRGGVSNLGGNVQRGEGRTRKDDEGEEAQLPWV